MEGQDGELRLHKLEAEHLFFDLGEAAMRLRSAEYEQGRQSLAIARASGLSVVLMHMQAGGSLREHAASGPTTIQVLDGHVRVLLGDDVLDAPAGRLIAFDGGARHAVEAVEDSTLLLTVTGPREL